MKEQNRDYGSILPCGGRGTRLIQVTEDAVPKSLVKVGGLELIRHSIDVLNPQIVKRLVFAVDYRAADIKTWVQNAKFPHIVQFSEQKEPGVLSAIASGAEYVVEDSMVACNTDEVRMGLKIADVVKYHEAQGTLATMVVAYSNNLSRHRVIEVRESDGRILKTNLKPNEYKNHPEKIGLINTGFLILEKRALEYFDPAHNKDWSGIIDPLCDAGQISAYIDKKIRYFNVGTPEEYEEAEKYLSQDS